MNSKVKIVIFTIIALMVTPMTSLAFATLQANTIKYDGSTTVLPILVEANPSFSALTGFNMPATTSQGSDFGFKLWQSGTAPGPYSQLVDVGGSSRYPKATDYPWTLPSGALGSTSTFGVWQIGTDSLGIILSTDNVLAQKIAAGTVPGLTRYAVAAIYLGLQETQTWDRWGVFYLGLAQGTLPATPIKPMGRLPSSGTYDSFNNFFLNVGTWARNCGEGKTPGPAGLTSFETYVPKPENIDIYNFMTTDPTKASYIAYIGYGFTQRPGLQLCPLGMDLTTATPPVSPPYVYVIPNDANIKSGAYSITRPLFLTTWNATATDMYPSPTMEKFVSYIRNHQNYIDDNGYIKIWRADFTGMSAMPSGFVWTTQQLPGDAKVDYKDILYFVNAYITYQGNNKKVDPMADMNYDYKVDYNDILSFVNQYIAYNAGGSPS